MVGDRAQDGREELLPQVTPRWMQLGPVAGQALISGQIDIAMRRSSLSTLLVLLLLICYLDQQCGWSDRWLHAGMGRVVVRVRTWAISRWRYRKFSAVISELQDFNGPVTFENVAAGV